MKPTLLAILLTIVACHAESQAPSADTKLEFEVASVKAVPVQLDRALMLGKRGGPGSSDPTHVVIENFPMILLVWESYHLNLAQVSGVSWAPERFNINAVLPAGTTKEQYQLMLQKLLADRFHLKVHHETKAMPVYEMSVAKDGPLVKPHVGDAVAPVPEYLTSEQARDKDGYPIPAPGEWATQRNGNTILYRFNLVGLTVPEFATKSGRPAGPDHCGCDRPNRDVRLRVLRLC